MLRNQIDKNNIQDINMEIEAHQRIIEYYESYLEQQDYIYVRERLNSLYSKVAEYIIAREIAEENALYRK
jgi:hypothetical protein